MTSEENKIKFQGTSLAESEAQHLEVIILRGTRR